MEDVTFSKLIFEGNENAWNTCFASLQLLHSPAFHGLVDHGGINTTLSSPCCHKSGI